jgi:DNA (cytosine-5)-methyltransferase 1
MIGQRVLDDPRNALVSEFLRIVHELDAKAFVFENVKGLTVGKHRQFLDEFVAMANDLGYSIRLPWCVLNAAHFGTPQNRERLILYGARRKAHLPQYPEATTRPADGKGRGPTSVPKGPSVAEAISDLPDADCFDELMDWDSVRPEVWGNPSAYVRELRCVSNDAWHYGYVRNWDPGLLTSSIRTNHTQISRLRFSETKGGQTEPISRFYKLSASGLSNTLRAGTDGTRGAFTSPRPIHYQLDRCVTVREMARLHGYPDWFRLHETKWHGARQIGNSVPPPLARAVAAQLIKALGYVPSRPFETLELGELRLLGMTVSQAASHFGVVAPPSKRDRKSGATKRKQEDIERVRLAYG